MGRLLQRVQDQFICRKSANVKKRHCSRRMRQRSGAAKFLRAAFENYTFPTYRDTSFAMAL